MKPLMLIGGGGHCHSCIDVIELTKLYSIKGVIQPDGAGLVMGYPVLGSDSDLPKLLKEINSVLITVGQIKSMKTRVKLYELVKQLGANLPVVISPNAYCSKNASVGEGTIIMHGAIVNAKSKVGANCIINSLALIEHDAIISDHCHISTGVKINGGVYIGRGSFVGSGVTIKEGITIGDEAVIGAGHVILKDVPSGSVVRKLYD